MCLPGASGGVAADVGALEREPVVFVVRLAVLHVEGPAAEVAGLRDDHAACLSSVTSTSAVMVCARL